MNRLRLAALVGTAVIAISVPFGTQPAHAADDAVFRVTPASGLFDVVLEAGVPEQRTITVQNTAVTAQQLHFSVTPSTGAPAAHLRDRIVLDVQAGTCDGSTVAALTLHELRHPRPTARFAGHQNATMCLTALLPIHAAPSRETATHVDLVFTSTPDGELAFTGAHPVHVSMAVLALAITALGVVLWRSSRKNGSHE